MFELLKYDLLLRMYMLVFWLLDEVDDEVFDEALLPDDDEVEVFMLSVLIYLSQNEVIVWVFDDEGL